uniref:Uncharacterized protein n=1 Tax=Plectus sambesii TaxID=2011161 RepID=A0A914XBC4_9BILA
ALRSKLQRLRPTVKELERRQTIMEQSWSSQSSKPCSTANESGTQFGDKSCAEDSGWMTDDDFDGTESRTISQCSSDKDFDSNTLPIITSGRLSVARLKGTESLNCNDATTTHFRTRLASLSVKLRDTERKLSALSKSDYSSSNSDESGPVSVQ